MLSLRTGKFVTTLEVNDSQPKEVAWDPSKKAFKISESTYVPVKSSSDGTTKIAESLPQAIMEIVNSPKYSNKKTQLMYAAGITHIKVTNSDAKAFGLFANSDGSDMHWEPIIDPAWKFK